jgi:hypothetical protein
MSTTGILAETGVEEASPESALYYYWVSDHSTAMLLLHWQLISHIFKVSHRDSRIRACKPVFIHSSMLLLSLSDPADEALPALNFSIFSFKDFIPSFTCTNLPVVSATFTSHVLHIRCSLIECSGCANMSGQATSQDPSSEARWWLQGDTSAPQPSCPQV